MYLTNLLITFKRLTLIEVYIHSCCIVSLILASPLISMCCLLIFTCLRNSWRYSNFLGNTFSSVCNKRVYLRNTITMSITHTTLRREITVERRKILLAMIHQFSQVKRPNLCSVCSCENSKRDHQKAAVFSFTSDASLIEKWMANIYRKYLNINSTSVFVCELNF